MKRKSHCDDINVLYFIGGNMDNRNVKIVDENNIDREGKVICGFSDNGNNYVLFFVNRDEEKE